jgi:hypothetical protein
MLLVVNLPQPTGLVVSGEASARENRFQLGTSRRAPAQDRRQLDSGVHAFHIQASVSIVG